VLHRGDGRAPALIEDNTAVTSPVARRRLRCRACPRRQAAHRHAWAWQKEQGQICYSCSAYACLGGFARAGAVMASARYLIKIMLPWPIRAATLLEVIGSNPTPATIFGITDVPYGDRMRCHRVDCQWRSLLYASRSLAAKRGVPQAMRTPLE
jgi:hypothetical protein